MTIKAIPWPPPRPPWDFLIGDVNGDGHVGNGDIDKVQNQKG